MYFSIGSTISLHGSTDSTTNGEWIGINCYTIEYLFSK